MSHTTPAPSPNRLAAGVLSCGETAKLLGCAPRTVANWFDSGHLPGYRLPGPGGHRRVLVAGLLSFLRRHGMPAPPALAGSDLVLWAGPRRAACGRWRVEPAADLYALGGMLAACRPAALVLDLALGRSSCLDAARRLAAGPTPPLLAAIACEDEADPGELAASFALVADAPAQMADRLDQLIA